MEDEATRRCSRPDGYNRLVERRRIRSETMRQERDNASGARSFFNSQKFSVRNLFSVRLVVAVTKLSDTLRSSGKSDIWCSV